MSAFAGAGERCPHVECVAVFAKRRNLEAHLEHVHRWKDGIAPRNAQLREKPERARTYLCVECDPPSEWPTFDARKAHTLDVHFADEPIQVEVVSATHRLAQPDTPGVICALRGCLKLLPPRSPNGGRPRKYCSDQCARKAARPEGPGGDHVCEQCEKGFPTSNALVGHMRAAHRPPVLCEVCGRSFAHSGLLAIHTNAKHPRTARDVDRSLISAALAERVTQTTTSAVSWCAEYRAALKRGRDELAQQLDRIDRALAALDGAS